MDPEYYVGVYNRCTLGNSERGGTVYTKYREHAEEEESSDMHPTQSEQIYER